MSHDAGRQDDAGTPGPARRPDEPRDPAQTHERGPAGQEPPENPFAAPAGPRPGTQPGGTYGDYGAAPASGGRQGPDPYAPGDSAGPPSPPGPHGPAAGAPAAPGAPGPPRTPAPAPPVFPGTERVDPAAVFGGAGYTAPELANHPLAVAAVVLGAFGVIPGVGVLAVVFGHLALARLRDEERGGRGLATTGLVLGYVLSVLWILLALALWVAP